MTTATQVKTYTFTYRGFTIEQHGDTYSVIQNGQHTGNTYDLIELIKKIDDAWSKQI